MKGREGGEGKRVSEPVSEYKHSHFIHSEGLETVSPQEQ